MQRRITVDVLDCDILDCLESIFILTYATKCNTKTSVEVRVGDYNVGAIGFNSYAIVAVEYSPAIERNLVREYCIRTISVAAGATGVCQVLYVDVFK